MLKKSCNWRFVSTLSASPFAILCCIVVLLQIISPLNQVLSFHLSFNHRLLKSVSNPQLNPANTLIRPVECRNANNHSEAGICMFAIDCMQNKGVPLSVCKHNYFVGTCCRLPDYNNFVGIVYDLRDTETNQLVEARGVAPIQAQPASADGALSSRTALASLSGSATNVPVSAPTPSETFSGGSAQPATTLSTQKGFSEQSAPATTTTTTQLPLFSSKPQPTKGVSPADKLDEKYIISSTNLFPSTINPLLASQLDIVQVRDKQQASIVKDALKLTPSSNAESARNADGGLPSSFIISSLAASNPNKQQQQQQQLVVPSELDSFQIQTTSTTANTSQSPQEADQQAGNKRIITGPHNAYELIKDNDSLEILSTISSVHSAPTTQQQFNIESHNVFQQDSIDPFRMRPTGGSQDRLQVRLQPPPPPPPPFQQQQQQNSVYSLIDNRLAPKNNSPQLTIVFANNHQLQSSTLRPPPPQSSPGIESGSSKTTSSQQPISDQEFTLSLAPSSTSPQQEEQSKASTAVSMASPSSAASFPASLSSESPANFSATVVSPAVSSQSAQASGNSWPPQTPFVDLVSSGNSAQTTTPFTTSLSTALLPNVSSHPYNPTTSAPISSLVPSFVASQQLNPNATSSTSNSSSSSSSSSSFGYKQATATSTTATSQKESSSGESVTAGSSSFSQLYSSQHSSTVSTFNSKNKLQSPQPSDDNQSTVVHNFNRPNLILTGGVAPSLQAATKIVTGGSSANHILPGLSNLQSAILSNIPYKLASHLSSGLSNYFQTAMKPVTGSRPLLSSNTAPSLQYQQQLQQQQLQNQANSSKPAQASVSPIASSTQQASPSVIKFPSLSSPFSSAPSVGQVDLTGAPSLVETTIAPAALWQFASSSKAPTTLAVRDVVKEAQQVCGRPQVSHPQGSTLIGEGAKKRVARIVGGNQSSFGQWPWMVSLRQWRKGAFLHKCGAALLNENWAITAAHCVENVKVTDLLLRLGEFDVSNQEEPFPFAERRVKSVVSHPSFDPKTFEYDLALLRFSEPIKYERNIIPVCVPSGNDSYVDRMATVIGWGRLYEDGPLPDVIQHVDVPIITNNECEKMYKNAGFIEEIPDMFICAGISKGGRDSCEGDSGGPLTMVDHDGRSYLVGIISWGIGCALPSQPGVYTRITAFSSWINQITGY